MRPLISLQDTSHSKPHNPLVLTRFHQNDCPNMSETRMIPTDMPKYREKPLKLQPHKNESDKVELRWESLFPKGEQKVSPENIHENNFSGYILHLMKKEAMNFK